MNAAYVETVRLMLGVIPAVSQEACFAIKGGTALNLFAGNMPRLSVDIDLVFTDGRLPRPEALEAIRQGLENIRAVLAAGGMECQGPASSVGEETKLFVRRNRSVVKIEVNQVFRGTLMPVKWMRLSPAASDLFATDFEARVLDRSELYGGKLVAAMDRQHPRDLFDVMGLYAGGGLSPEIVECFVGYLAGHNRPLHEVLFPRESDPRSAYAGEFAGMTREFVALDDLLETRRRLMEELPRLLTPLHRSFLLGLVRAEPDWNSMSCGHLESMPAIRWKLENLGRLRKTNRRKFLEQEDLLRARFEVCPLTPFPFNSSGNPQ